MAPAIRDLATELGEKLREEVKRRTIGGGLQEVTPGSTTSGAAASGFDADFAAALNAKLAESAGGMPNQGQGGSGIDASDLQAKLMEIIGTVPNQGQASAALRGFDLSFADALQGKLAALPLQSDAEHASDEDLFKAALMESLNTGQLEAQTKRKLAKLEAQSSGEQVAAEDTEEFMRNPRAPRTTMANSAEMAKQIHGLDFPNELAQAREEFPEQYPSAAAAPPRISGSEHRADQHRGERPLPGTRALLSKEALESENKGLRKEILVLRAEIARRREELGLARCRGESSGPPPRMGLA